MYKFDNSNFICEFMKLFGPSYVVERSASIDLVARLAKIKPSGERQGLTAPLQRDLPTYIAAANGFSIDHGDVGDFTDEILIWWKSHASEVGAWSEAARIAFAMAPNTAGAERAFTWLKTLFGSNLGTSFSGYICGSTRRANEARK